MSTAEKPRPVEGIVGLRRDDAGWKGKHEEKFNWRKLRWEWGRNCYRTNHAGKTLEAWWEADEQPN